MKGLFIYQKGSISDYRDDELGRIKEYLKKIGIATVAYGREYQAPQMVLIPDDNEKNAEISRLQAENAELRAMLEKARELPCKVGDTIYQTDTNGTRIFKSTVKNIIFETDGVAFDERAIGESIFLTEEAVKEKMKELNGGER